MILIFYSNNEISVFVLLYKVFKFNSLTVGQWQMLSTSWQDVLFKRNGQTKLMIYALETSLVKIFSTHVTQKLKTIFFGQSCLAVFVYHCSLFVIQEPGGLVRLQNLNLLSPLPKHGRPSKRTE